MFKKEDLINLIKMSKSGKKYGLDCEQGILQHKKIADEKGVVKFYTDIPIDDVKIKELLTTTGTPYFAFYYGDSNFKGIHYVATIVEILKDEELDDDLNSPDYYKKGQVCFVLKNFVKIEQPYDFAEFEFVENRIHNGKMIKVKDTVEKSKPPRMYIKLK